MPVSVEVVKRQIFTTDCVLIGYSITVQEEKSLHDPITVSQIIITIHSNIHIVITKYTLIIITNYYLYMTIKIKNLFFGQGNNTISFKLQLIIKTWPTMQGLHFHYYYEKTYRIQFLYILRFFYKNIHLYGVYFCQKKEKETF